MRVQKSGILGALIAGVFTIIFGASWPPLANAATYSGVGVTNVTLSGPVASMSTVITVTGHNFPALTGAATAADGGTNYTNFAWGDPTEHSAWGFAGNSIYAADYNGVNIIQASSTEIQFTLGGLSGSNIKQGDTFHVQFGTGPTTYGTYDSATGTFTANSQATVPTGLTATPGISSVALAWTSGTGDAAYNVYVNGKLFATDIPATSYTASGLTGGVQYSFTVSALDSGGTETVQTSPATAAPIPPMPVAAPTGVKVSGSSGGAGSISWSDPTAPTGTTYTITVDGKTVGTTSGTSLPLSNYDPGAVYVITASAPNYVSSSTTYTASSVSNFQSPFSASDLFTNSVRVVASAGGLILLLLVLIFGPRLNRFVHGAIERRHSTQAAYRDLGYGIKQREVRESGRDLGYTKTDEPSSDVNVDRPSVDPTVAKTSSIPITLRITAEATTTKSISYE